MFTKKQSKIKNILGIPDRFTWQDIVDVVKRFKFIFFIYIFIWILYAIFFIVFKDWTQCVLDRAFGFSVGTGFSASLLEDLLFSVVIGFMITFISIMVSAKTPEDHEFKRRVSAVLNRSDVDEEARDFFKESIVKHLAYYEDMYCEIILNDYDEDEQAFSIITKRIQVLKNMCSDYPYSDNASLSIEPDTEVKGDLGNLRYLKVYNVADGSVIDSVVDEADNYKLEEGLNTQEALLNIAPNGEIGLRYKYRIWVKGAAEDEIFNFYLGSARFAKKMTIHITNKIPSKKTIRFNSKIYRLSENTENSLGTSKILFGDQNRQVITVDLLYPGDKIKLNFPVIN